MATTDDIMTAIRNADAAGDSSAVRQLAVVLKRMNAVEQQEAQRQKERVDPTANMSTTERVLAGAGKAMTDVGRGAGQLLRKALPDSAADAIGLPNQADIDEAKQRDQALMRTAAGKVGNIMGAVATALPTVFIPGVNTVAGSGAVGATMGLLQPVASDESRLKNVLVGGTVGAAAPVVARGLAAGYQGAKALVEPFTAKGREAIAGRTLDRFGVEAGDLAGATSNPTVTGAVPTLAEQIQRPEGAAAAARLQDSIRSVDPRAAAQFTAREVENNAARVGTLRDLAGAGGQRDFYQASRSAAAKELYDDAFSIGMDITKMSAAERGEITKLLKTPAIKDALKSAQEIAQNQGTSLARNPQGSVEGLHNMKLALDDQINALSNGSASQVNKARAITAARDRLVTFIERISPKYGEARATYAEMSKPINQMDVAEELFRKGTSATSDLGGTPRLMPNSYIGQLKNEEALVKGATGRDLGKLSEVLDPDQFNKIISVGKELDKQAAVGRAANGPGSATAQRMASQNVLRQILGPTGLPESWAESTMLNTMMRPVQFAYNGVAEPRIQAVVTDLLLNPGKAQAALQLARTAPQRLPPEVQAALPYLEQALKSSAPAAALTGQR